MFSSKILLNTNKIKAKKQLGQNFLLDKSTAVAIVNRSNINKNDIILEIGAGLGALTFLIADQAKMVYAVEKDHEIVEILKSEIDSNQYANIKIIEQDILKLDLNSLEMNNDKIVVIGNLPYNISSQVLIYLINSRSLIKKAVVMFQKELAQRILTQCGRRESNRISIMLQYCADVKSIAKVKAESFYPKPKVNSEVLEIIFKEDIAYKAKNETFLFKVIKACFGQRRKNLKNALCGSELHLNSDTANNILKLSNIESNMRAESLAIEEFVNLSNVLYDMISTF